MLLFLLFSVFAEVHEVKIVNMKFVPKYVNIKSGDTVRWINMVSTQHDVVEEFEIFKSGFLKKNETFEYTFNGTGLYRYHCTPHRTMGMVGGVFVKP